MNAYGGGTPAPASPKRLARIAGALYLVVAVFAAFAYNIATGKVYVAGDAAATAQRLVANAWLVRAGAVSSIVEAVAWILVAIAFYLLLRHANEAQARAMVVFVAVGAGVVSVSEAFRIAALSVAAGSSYVTAFGVAGSNALSLLLLDLHHFGMLNASVFMGLWLIPLGYLVSKSALFPKALGALLVAGGVCYLVGVLAVYVSPESGEALKAMLINVATIGEVWLLGYLLTIGVRSAPRIDRAAAA